MKSKGANHFTVKTKKSGSAVNTHHNTSMVTIDSTKKKRLL